MKSQIFGMYLGQQVRCKRYIDNNGNPEFLGEYEYKLEGINTGDNYEYAIADNDEFEFDDCQLILKPISEMDEVDKADFYSNLAEIGDGTDEYQPTEKDDLDSWIAKVLWLIEHGYALDDAWFEQGIAIKGDEVKQ